MKKITTFFFGIFCMLSVANAQDITLFDFDGVTPTTDSYSDSFVSAANPVSDGVNSSANVGQYTHSAQWSNVTLTSPVVSLDSRVYTSYELSIYSPAAGTVTVALKNAADAELEWFSQSVPVTAGWTKITHTLPFVGTIAKVVVAFNFGGVPAGNSNDIVYLDNLVFKKSTDTFIKLYSETFYASWSQYDSWTGAPSTKAGSWFGGVNLESTGDAAITLDRWWNDPHAQGHTLKLSPTSADVIIPNINVTGFDSLKLSFESTRAGDSALPIVAVKIGAGDWVSVTTLSSGSFWGFSGVPQVDLLKDAGGNAISNVSAISIKLSSSPDVDIFYDNVKIFGKVHSGITTSLSNESKAVFSVYPNPATNYILTKNAQKVTILDLNGRVVKEAFNTEKVDISSLSKGAYLVKVSVAGSTKVGKLIKK